MTDAPLAWRKSTFSTSAEQCVELARHADGPVLVRNSKRPDAGTLAVEPAPMAAWVAGTAAGDLDDLTV